eukprot:365232-Chlamydomonas_euryale.AAC.5
MARFLCHGTSRVCSHAAHLRPPRTCVCSYMRHQQLLLQHPAKGRLSCMHGVAVPTADVPMKQTNLVQKTCSVQTRSKHVHAQGSYIRGTNGSSNGILPMLRVFNDTARYVDQGGGKRKGAFAVYLEPWHADVFDFLDLRKNTGEMVGRGGSVGQARQRGCGCGCGGRKQGEGAHEDPPTPIPSRPAHPSACGTVPGPRSLMWGWRPRGITTRSACRGGGLSLRG